MKTFLKKIAVIFTILITPLIFLNCEKNEDDINDTIIEIYVKSQATNANIANANVILFNADNGQAVNRSSSDANGKCSFTVTAGGNYYVEISAQGYLPSPPKNLTAVPFAATTGQTTAQTFLLETSTVAGGYVYGYVSPVVNGVLVIAESDLNGSRYSGITGPDGYYVIFNVPYASYKMYAYKAGYTATSIPTFKISSGTPTANKTVNLTTVTGGTLTGKVSFLATTYTGTVDVTILDHSTRTPIPGLTDNLDENANYSISSIPPGQYMTWASFQNDGYVMDPDWIYKNPNGLYISYESDSTKTRNFSVTGAITLNSPTNSASSLIPVIVTTTTPTFSWTSYPSAKEYIIEVRDMSGNIVWGGYNTTNGFINHQQILSSTTSVVYNFDGSATTALQSGKTYQWKIYADDDNAAKVQTLISCSEDLRGLFKVQ
ncbi:MAG: carboxypeptidase regulatory-like domain-containing protein [Ignavibacteriales bacterium]|nr:carboxypeptidase regulatory-like domain-containing protein [Ignavibacteriales bacterium]